MLVETGILENVPIVSNILNGAAMINEIIDGRDDCEGALAELRDTLNLVEPVTVQLSEAEHLLHDKALHGNLEAVSNTLEGIWDHVNEYNTTQAVLKYARSGSSEQQFQDDLDTLKKGLDNLSFMIFGETFVTMLNTKKAVDGLAEKLEKLGAHKRASDVRKEREEEMGIDERLVDWIEVDGWGVPKPFAKGSFGSVFRVKYEGEIIAAKSMDMTGFRTQQSEQMKKGFQKEVALMGALHSTNIVSILGAFTRPKEWAMSLKIPWEGLDLSQIVGKVAYEGKRLEVTGEMDGDLKRLMNTCWNKVPEERPDFQRIIKILEPLLGENGRVSPGPPTSFEIFSLAAFSPAKPGLEKAGSSSLGGRKGMGMIQNVTEELWGKLLAEVGGKEGSKEISFDDDFVAALELGFLEGEDVTDLQEGWLKSALCKRGDIVLLTQFKKLVMKWKKSAEAEAFARYLGVASSEPRSRGEGSLGSFGSEVEVAAPVATTVHAHAQAHTVPIDAVKVVPDGSYGGGGENEDVIDGYWDSGDACQKRGDLL
ncbi:hypothetical protein TL16_g07205 [Triparma laevis f. inornata]|uniref:Tyrosine-protein kinase catalytic domain-containing protein n=1 Tax=Triparma laevis f. inornata TaxID=1714386 RepID=A0A9W7AZK2_9STRA|nr:hypothetical protein TL16_g07205 [Triparma laevis f. inornata]